MERISMVIEQTAEVCERANVSINDVSFKVMEAAFNVGIDETLKEIAMFKMMALEQDLVQLECDTPYKDTWGELSRENEELYERVVGNFRNVIDQTFILAFIEGYKMMKVIAEQKEQGERLGV